MAHFTLEAE